jgi:endonuclease YncB( thermonuclease family)
MRSLRQVLAFLGALASILALPVLLGEAARPRAQGLLETGPMKVIDGDTLQVDGRVFEIFGIDAPEWGQRCLNGGALTKCGHDAAFRLKQRVDIDPLACRPAPDGAPPGHLVCMSGDASVAHLMLTEGSAVASSGAPAEYREVERQARDAGLGLWRGRFIPPTDWAAGARLPEEAAEPEPCPVLGLTLAGGARVYLVPTDADHKAHEAAGAAERFCSDAAARAAGYRRPGEAG